ncbi:MAG: GntR family transcriptional regulator [Desulfosarcinaceae bacterium]|nr:GntR family transcriptional regulator [Desulfosarcinaceae bacterium]
MESLFQEVQVEKVSDKIVDQLCRLIQEGKLTPGHRLPGERKLIEMLGVGRSSLREALNKLETLGYIEIRKRKGIFVRSIDSTLQLDPLKKLIQEDQHKVVQLYEVRSDIEQASAFAAASAHTAADLETIRNHLNRFTEPSGALTFSWQHDLDFHCAIARASHNLFRVHATIGILDFAREFIQPILEGFALSATHSATIVEQHRAIYTAIAARDGAAAREEMKIHLDWTNQKLVEHLN